MKSHIKNLLQCPATYSCFFIAFTLFVSTALHAEPPRRGLKIVIVGDSTVANYKDSDILRGWGQLIGAHFIGGTDITNLALCGASTKTFLATPRWKEARELHPDFILIQFGHNDSHAIDQPEATRAKGDYTENLRRFVRESRDIGAVPILITPMHRRIFSSGGGCSNELLPYVEAMKAVGAEMNVSVVDLYTPSGEMFSRLGDAGSSDLTAPNDRTHFSEKGAKLIASIVAKGLADVPDSKLQGILLPVESPQAH